MQKLTAADPETRSADPVADNLERLKALFPEAFTEGKIDFDVLRQLLGGAVDEREEKYGLTWHGKRRARQLALTPSTGTLRPCREESVDWDTTQNLMIEGDNLEVLKLLQKSYAAKVKVVYIDPPYNTGKDFVYSDQYQDGIRNYLKATRQAGEDGLKMASNTESSGRYHSNWLSMMYPRLRLARNLLAMDGVLLISIDDHEIHHLRQICDNVFGEENFIASITWEKGRKNDAKLFSAGHEYVLVFARSQTTLRERNIIWREEKPGAREIWEAYLGFRASHGKDDDAVETALQEWYSALPKSHPAKKWSRYKRVDRYGPWRDRDISWPGGGGPRYDVLHPRTGLPCRVPERGWIYSSPQEMERKIRAGLVEFRDDHTEPPFRKAHIKPVPDEISVEAETEDLDDGDAEDEVEAFATQVRGTYFYKQSQVAVKELRELLGAKVFNNPKDHSEIARLIDYVSAGDPDGVFLDFFAGSGSLGHAVLDLNAADQGSRKFILVQIPEPLDAEKKEHKVAARFCAELNAPMSVAEITKERIRRAGRKLRRQSTDHAAALDTGFRVFKLDSSNIRTWEPDRDDLEMTLESSIEHIKAGRTEQDILFELLLKLGLDLTVPIEQREIAGKTVHNIGAGTLLVCLAERIGRDDVEPLSHGIVAWHREIAPAGDTHVVFRDSAFADDVVKTNVAAILEQHGLKHVRSL